MTDDGAAWGGIGAAGGGNELPSGTHVLIDAQLSVSDAETFSIV